MSDVEAQRPSRAPVAETNKVVVRNLNFYYGQAHALKSVNLNLLEGEVTAFIGPSGCGKSTLLRVLNRMYDLYPGQRAEGEVMLDGENILSANLDLNLLRSRVGMVFQKPTPFPMTIYDNIAFGIRLYEKLPKSEMDARVEQALSRAALWNEVKDKLNASGLSLSGGQQQRLCIARTVAISPEVILLDEPASALDPISTAKIEELVDELSGDYTIAIVTHNMQQAARSRATPPSCIWARWSSTMRRTRCSPRRATSARRITSLAASAEGGTPVADQHTVRAYDKDLDLLERRIAEMGGLAEKMVIEAVDALRFRRCRACPSGGGDRPPPRCASARDRGAGDADDRAPAAGGESTCARSSAPFGSRAISSGWGSGQEHRQARAQDRHGRPGAPRHRRHQAHERVRHRADEGRARRLCAARRRAGARRVGAGRRSRRARKTRCSAIF